MAMYFNVKGEDESDARRLPGHALEKQNHFMAISATSQNDINPSIMDENDAKRMKVDIGRKDETDPVMEDGDQEPHSPTKDIQTPNADSFSYASNNITTLQDINNISSPSLCEANSEHHAEKAFLPPSSSVNLAGLHHQTANILGSTKAREAHSHKGLKSEEESDIQPELLLQREITPVSFEQLAQTVEDSYDWVLTIEAKCIEIDERQWAAAKEKSSQHLKDDQWQSLIALHKQLLHEHHAIFVASQHPSGSATLARLPAQYLMPARLWDHGIHKFLEVLLLRLPQSKEHIRTFIHICYAMLALLYEIVPSFNDTWTERLGDLGRYRMAIEEDDLRDRRVWTNVAEYWYNKAADIAPHTGRLYHHLAITETSMLSKLMLFRTSLGCICPYSTARGSMHSAFRNLASYQTHWETLFVKAHDGLAQGSVETFLRASNLLSDKMIEDYIQSKAGNFQENGISIAISNTAAVFECGISESDIPTELEATEIKRSFALKFTFRIFMAALQCKRDLTTLPFMHVMFAFLWSLSHKVEVRSYFESDIPGAEICDFLNILTKSQKVTAKIRHKSFPVPEKGHPVPLLEDYALRAQIYSASYFPRDWFKQILDASDRRVDSPSIHETRVERIFWLGFRIAASTSWIAFDQDSEKFHTPYEVSADATI